jgi:peptidoglycan hydrolase-like protein with peptidoglycan-binding domain
VHEPEFADGVGDVRSIEGFATREVDIDPALELGDSGSDVETLQAQRVGLGFPLVVDGLFGPFTKDVVHRFQSMI